MSNVLDAIDSIANASVEVMGKLPEVPDDVTWAWKILESVDGVSARMRQSLDPVLEKLEMVSHGSSIISPEVSYDTEKNLHEVTELMSVWRRRVAVIAERLMDAAVRMIVVCEIKKLRHSDWDMRDLIDHGLLKVTRSTKGDVDELLLAFDSGETAAVVASFNTGILKRKAIAGLVDADIDRDFLLMLDEEDTKQDALLLADELSELVKKADYIEASLRDALNGLPATK